MERVYVISRYRAATIWQLEFNKAVARHFCKRIVEEGKIPVAPHLYYTQFLNDNIPEHRECGLGLGLYELRNCDEFLLVIIDGIISEGMVNEIKELSKLGIPGRIVTMTSKEAKKEIGRIDFIIRR